MPAERQVAVFFSHGSPMAAIEEADPYAEAVREFGRRRPRPRAIVMVSAHWQERRPVRVTAWKSRPVIHDFSGFPEELYRLSYPAPGDEGLAAEIAAMLGDAVLDRERGLDHGAWVPLRYAWPEADIPVVQVSLPDGATPRELWELGRRLRPLRELDVLVAGSGGIVHNLRRVVFRDKQAPVEAWAAEFDGWVAERLDGSRFEELLVYRTEAPHASLAVPTTEHFDPMFCVLGAAFDGERARSFYEAFQYGNLSMRCFSVT